MLFMFMFIYHVIYNTFGLKRIFGLKRLDLCFICCWGMYLRYLKCFQHCSNGDKSLILHKVTLPFIWSPAALTPGSESDSEEGGWLTRLTRGNKVKKYPPQNTKLLFCLVTVIVETSFLFTESIGVYQQCVLVLRTTISSNTISIRLRLNFW